MASKHILHVTERDLFIGLMSGNSLDGVDAALLAELTGISVVADFRRRNIAAGGQGRAAGSDFSRRCAWLAKQMLDAKQGNLPAVTGAGSERVLGAIYPA